MTYNKDMKNEVIPQVLVETMPYQRAVEKIWDIETQMEFKIYIGLNPYSGNLIPGTGGIRKIRWQGSGRGKRGGVRVIYYVYNESQPIYLLYAYPKNVQVDLTEDEKRVLRDIVEEMKAVFHRKEEQHGADDVRCGK